MKAENRGKEKATELRAEFLAAVQALAKHWDRLSIPNCEKLDGVTFSILALLDNLNMGVNAHYELYRDNYAKPINGRLHELYSTPITHEPNHPPEWFAYGVQQLLLGEQGKDAHNMAFWVVFNTVRLCHLWADGCCLTDTPAEFAHELSACLPIFDI